MALNFTLILTVLLAGIIVLIFLFEILRLRRVRNTLQRFVVEMRTLYFLLRTNWLERLSVVVYICTIILFTIFLAAGLFSLTSWIIQLTTATAAIFVILARLKHSSTQIGVISSVAQYLIKGDISLIDDLLGRFISGRWQFKDSDPAESFFGSLEDLAVQGSYEMRRRISEALPALFHWKLKNSISLANVLRRDWDDRWRSDIRRRVVEATPYLLKKNPDAAKSFLEVHEKDEIYTIIAIAEVSHEWLKVEKKRAEEFLKNFKVTIKKCYSLEENEAIVELLNLLDLIEKNKFEACQKMSELSENKNVFVRIAVARNLPKIFDAYPEVCLKLMEFFLRSEEIKYVRRPIAKELSTKAIINALKETRFKDRAESILWKLIKDSDDIIRITAFDLIDDLQKIDIKLCQKIVSYIIGAEKNKDLLRRAGKTQEDLEKMGKV